MEKLAARNPVTSQPATSSRRRFVVATSSRNSPGVCMVARTCE